MTIDKQLLATLVQLFYWIVALALIAEVGDAVIKEMGFKKGMRFILSITVPITVLYYFVVEVGGFSPLLFALITVVSATLAGVVYYFMKKLHHKNSD